MKSSLKSSSFFTSEKTNLPSLKKTTIYANWDIVESAREKDIAKRSLQKLNQTMSPNNTTSFTRTNHTHSSLKGINFMLPDKNNSNVFKKVTDSPFNSKTSALDKHSSIKNQSLLSVDPYMNNVARRISRQQLGSDND